MSQELINAITEMREDDALKISNELLDAGTAPLEVLDACREAMDVIGKRFEAGEAFIPELILAGEMMTAISDVIKPRMAEEAASEKLGKIVIGTVEGDIHDIAKDIVSFMLDLNGFEVTDLGVDVPPAKFVRNRQRNWRYHGWLKRLPHPGLRSDEGYGCGVERGWSGCQNHDRWRSD